jgi:putative intracellular protease/amidase
VATILIPIPDRDFDPTEVAVSWSVLTGMGHRAVFATPDGTPGVADYIMMTGEGLDPWSGWPVIGRFRLLGSLLRADRRGRDAHRRMLASAAFSDPIRWDAARVADFDALLLPGGHRARGMRLYLESPVLQTLVTAFFAAGKPVGAICHGVLLAARSRGADGRSVLFGRKTTALTWALEGAADKLARFGRRSDPDYYRTYLEAPGEPEGYMSVEQEVTRALADPSDFRDVPADAPDRRNKTSGLHRDTPDDARPAWVVTDGHYVSARWPGDAHTFARTLGEMLAPTPTLETAAHG